MSLILDSAYDDPTDPRGGNTATCAYVNDIAANEALHLSCRVGNPTGTGIHNRILQPLALSWHWAYNLLAAFTTRTPRDVATIRGDGQRGVSTSAP